MEGSILTLPLFVPSHAIYDQTGQIMPCIRSAYIADVLPTLLRAFTLLSTGAWLFRTRSEDVSTICADRRHLAIIDVIQGERDIASCALEKIYLNKRDIPKKSKRRSPKNLPKECSRNKKGSTWPMSKHHWDRWQGERWTFFPQIEGSSHHDLTQQQVHQHWVAASIPTPSTPTISPIFGCKRTMTVFASPSGRMI